MADITVVELAVVAGYPIIVWKSRGSILPDATVVVELVGTIDCPWSEDAPEKASEWIWRGHFPLDTRSDPATLCCFLSTVDYPDYILI